MKARSDRVSRSRLARWGAAALLATAWPSPARGQDRTEHPAAGSTTQVATLLETAVKAFGDGRYEEARLAYAQAYKLDPQTRTLMELALAEFRSDHPVEAAAHWNEYLKRPDATLDMLDAVRNIWLRQVASRIARLDVYVPPGAEVRIDGVPQPAPETPPGASTEVPVGVDIRAGQHEVEAHRGSAVQVRYVVAQGGQRVEVHFHEEPTASPILNHSAPPDPPGAARLAAREGDSIPPARWITTVVLGAAAVLSASTGVGFAIAYEVHGAEADRLRANGNPSTCYADSSNPVCAQLQSAHNAQRTDGALAAGLLVGGGIAAGLAATWWFLWPSRSAAASARLIPLVDDRTSGLALRGAW